MSCDLIYPTELAIMLGTTTTAIRAKIYRKMILGQPIDLPTPIRFGVKWAWRRETVKKWLSDKEQSR